MSGGLGASRVQCQVIGLSSLSTKIVDKAGGGGTENTRRKGDDASPGFAPSGG
jgi:hypothetical protein